MPISIKSSIVRLLLSTTTRLTTPVSTGFVMKTKPSSAVNDNFFVLQGKSCTPIISERPEYLTNTQQTISRQKLKTDGYNPQRYSRSESPNTMRKSVSFSENELQEAIRDTRNKNSIDTADREIIDILNQSSDYGGGKPNSLSESEWYTRPFHLNRDQYPSFRSIGLPERSITPVDRSAGVVGADLAAQSLNSTNLIQPAIQPDYDYLKKMPEIDRLAGIYFPVTLSASKLIQKTVVPPKTISGPAKGLPEPGAPWRPISEVKKKKKRSKSPFKIDKPRMDDVEKMYLMSQNAPVIKSSMVNLPSPYHYDIATLRMERLRLEEEHLLEVKRIRELERIRGPTPKWYELKGPNFHYEARKNNELVRSQPNWQELLDYREELIAASKEFKDFHNSRQMLNSY